MKASGVYRSGRGTIWRVIEGEDGSLKVELLKDDAWIPGRIGMVGLRLAASTTRLSARDIRALPD